MRTMVESVVGPGGTASGRRRYNGTSGSDGSPALIRAAARSISVPGSG